MGDLKRFNIYLCGTNELMQRDSPIGELVYAKDAITALKLSQSEVARLKAENDEFHKFIERLRYADGITGIDLIEQLQEGKVILPRRPLPPSGTEINKENSNG